MKMRVLLALVVSGVMVSASMAQETVRVGGKPMYPNKNIVENAVNSADHTTLVAAVANLWIRQVVSTIRMRSTPQARVQLPQAGHRFRIGGPVGFDEVRRLPLVLLQARVKR